MSCDRVWTNARLATLDPSQPGLGLVERAALAAADGRIVYAGPAADLPADLRARETIDCAGRLITPGLVDCHTHLVHAGHRAREFEQRLAGASYEEIAKRGGGIASSVRATRAASEDTLVDAALPRLDALLAEGVTTVEVKSGYGLTLDDELRMLRAARRLASLRDVTVRTTFLGAHVVPPEFAGRAEDYVAHVCDVMLPAAAAAGLADAVDAFCESIAFDLDQTRRLLTAARALGLPVKLHAEQLSRSGAAELAAEFGALSADHLEHLDAGGARALAAAGTAAVLLPGAFLYLRESQKPPIDELRRHGVRMSIASDCNPGTSPMPSVLTAATLAALQFGLTVDECIAGITREGARALGLAADRGTLERGKRCDLAIWDVEDPAELVYWLGLRPLHSRVVGGTPSASAVRGGSRGTAPTT
jgi:imidazolonepropionase